jgi:hypothetical protein
MRIADRETWRYPGDLRLLTTLLAEEPIKQRLASSAYAVARNTKRSQLLAGAVRVEPDVLPHLAVAMDRLHAEFPGLKRVECFVFSHHEMNAFVCEGRTSTIVGLSSAAVNHLDADELMFVLGHEFGHAAFGHLELLAGHLVEDPQIPPAATMRIRAWQRASEISADRAGRVLAGSLSAAARSLFKVASGIVSASVAAGPERFAAQWQQLVEEVVKEGDRDFHQFSHPFPPLRMQAMQLFWDASQADDGGQTAWRTANDAVERMLATMDPAASTDRLGDPLLSGQFFWGGLYLAVGGESLPPLQRDRLATVAPDGIDVDAAIAEARQGPEACRDRFVEALRARRRKFNALEVHRIIYGILDVASADGSLQEHDLVSLRELADLLGVSGQACDLVVSQYKKETRNDA